MPRKLERTHLFCLMLFLSYGLMMAANVPILGLVGHVLLLFSTLAHELGHGLTTILLGGHFESLKIHWDASGETGSLYQAGAFRAAAIAAGGLIGPSFAASWLFWAARGSDRRLRWTTQILGATLILIGILTGRSFWALVFTVGVGPLLFFAGRRLSRQGLEAAVVFVGVQLGLSVFTRSDYLFTQWAGPGLPSDVAQIANNLLLPYWFWGVLCGAISLAVLFWGFRCYTRKD